MHTLTRIDPRAVQRVLHVRDAGTSTLYIQVRGLGWFMDRRSVPCGPPNKKQLLDCLRAEGPFTKVQVTEVPL